MVSLLKDPVKRQLRHEVEREGLIIQEATYRMVEEGYKDESIALDVKLPLQSLVRHSQLHIPGGSSKVNAYTMCIFILANSLISTHASFMPRLPCKGFRTLPHLLRKFYVFATRSVDATITRRFLTIYLSFYR